MDRRGSPVCDGLSFGVVAMNSRITSIALSWVSTGFVLIAWMLSCDDDYKAAFSALLLAYIALSLSNFVNEFSRGEVE